MYPDQWQLQNVTDNLRDADAARGAEKGCFVFIPKFRLLCIVDCVTQKLGHRENVRESQSEA